MKQVIIIHGWGGNPEEGWLPWARKILESTGFKVQIPAMPDTESPDIEKWVGILRQTITKPDEQAYLIGHSIGCQAILRYLESLPVSIKIGGVIFVAGWFDLDNIESDEERAIAKPWINTPIDFVKIKSHCEKFTVILSDNDPFGFLESNKKIFEEKLDARVLVLQNRGHLIETQELPEVIREIEKF
ncbi:MAG: alpha/beta hydrolase [Patescibacteria group bacterium]|jgi:hypothetical protein